MHQAQTTFKKDEMVQLDRTREPLEYEENIEANKRRYQRVCVAISGRFMREDREEFPCRVENISIGGAALLTPGICQAGETIILYLDDLGRLSGTVVRATPTGLALSFDLDTHMRNRLADRLTWLVNRDLLDGTSHRIFDRYRPGNKNVFVQYEDGSQEETRLENVSLSGASLQVIRRPRIGSRLVVGKLRAKVIRHHPKGIAVQFLDIQKPAALSPFFR